MRREAMWRVALVGAFVGVSLSGCGSGSDEPAGPPGYRPANLAAAWKNHFDAFGAKDVTKIKLDYDSSSILRVFNDISDDGSTLQEYTGLDNIGSFFTQLFQDLGSGSVDVKVDELRDGPAGARTEFLVWNSPLERFNRATDTFVFDSNFKIRVQNIVINRPSSTASFARSSNSTARRLLTPTQALANYEAALVKPAFSPVDLAANYEQDENTVIQHYEWTTDKYTQYQGSVGISDFHGPGFLDVPVTNILQVVRKVDESARTAFLLWKADEFESVANTFVYDAAGKIRTHTVVTKRKTSRAESKNGDATMMV